MNKLLTYLLTVYLKQLLFTSHNTIFFFYFFFLLIIIIASSGIRSPDPWRQQIADEYAHKTTAPHKSEVTILYVVYFSQCLGAEHLKLWLKNNHHKSPKENVSSVVYIVYEVSNKHTHRIINYSTNAHPLLKESNHIKERERERERYIFLCISWSRVG